MADLTGSLRELRRALATMAAAGVVAMAAIAVAGLTIPTLLAKARTVSVPYYQQFSLRYSGRPSPGGIYGSTPPTTGEPLYLGSLEDLTMVLRYRLSSAADTLVTGTLSAAVVVDDQGLDRFVVAPAKIPISQGAAQIRITVPLARYAQLVSRLSAADGAASYPVDVVAASAVTGTVAGRRINRTAQASYAFAGTPTALLAAGSGSGGGGTPSSSAAVSPAFALSGTGAVGPAMLSSSSATVTRSIPAAHDVTIGGIGIPGMAVGGAALLVAVVAGVAAVVLAGRLRRRWHNDPRLAVVARLGNRVVALHGGLPAGRIVVDVERAEDLLRLSRLLEMPILRVDEQKGRTMFLVHDDRYVYRHSVGAIADAQIPAVGDQLPAARIWWPPAHCASPRAVVPNGSAIEGPQPGDVGS